MRRRLWAGLIFLIAGCSGGGDAGTGTGPTPPSGGPSPADTLAVALEGLPLDQFYADSFAALIKRSPETVVWDALTDVYPLDSVELDDLSDDYAHDTFAMYCVVLDALRTYDRASLDAAGQVNYDFYEWYLQDTVDGEPFFYHDFPATYSIYGTQDETLTFFTDIHPLASLQDAEDYIQRLALVERKFAQLVDHLDAQRQNGIVEPALTLRIAINEATPFAQGTATSNPYYTSFTSRIGAIAGLTASQRTDLQQRALDATRNSVIPAYQDLRSKLQQLLNNAPPSIGVSQYPDGRDYYAYALRHHTTTSLTPAEVRQLGLDELTRIHAEMRLIFDQLGYPQNETLQQLFARVAADGGIVPAADVLPTYEAIIDAAEQRLDEA